MKRANRLVSALLSAVLVATAPSPRAWAGVAAVRTAPAGQQIAPLSPVAGSMGAGAPLASVAGPLSLVELTGSALPVLSAPAFKGPALSGPEAALQAPAPLAHARGTQALKASAPLKGSPIATVTPADAAIARASAVRPAAPARSVRARTGKLSSAVAPLLETIGRTDAAPASLRSSGLRLQELLSGNAGTRRSGVVPAEAGKTLRQGLKSRSCPGCNHEPFHIDGEDIPVASLLQAHDVPPEVKKSFRYYAMGVSSVKVGIETLNLVVPLLVLAQSGAATLVGALFVASELAGMVAGWVSGPLIDRLKPAWVMAGTAFIQVGVIGLIPALLAMNVAVSMPVIFALFTLNGALAGVFDIARRAEMPHIFGRDEDTLRKFNAMVYIWREIAAIVAVFGAGIWLAQAGYLKTLALHPIFHLVAAYVLMRLALRKSNAVKDPFHKHHAEHEQHEHKQGIKAHLAELLKGAKIVWKDPTMRLATMVNIPVLVLHKLFHAIIAVVYATQVLGNPALAAVIIGAWNVGELATALVLKYKPKQRSSFSWLPFGAVAVLSGWLMWFFPTIWVATPVTFVMSMAMLGNELNLAAYFQSSVPEEDVGATTGFIYSLATAVSMLALLGMGWVFDAFAGTSGVLVFAGILTAISIFYLVTDRLLRRQQRKEDDKKQAPGTY